MANAYKTTSNSKLQEQSMKTAIKSQLVIKIKKEEEEGVWMSEKKLYTEDNSDEKKFKTQSQSRSKFDDNQSLSLVNNIEQQNHSFISTENKAKLKNSTRTPENNINEDQFALKTVEKCNKISFINLTRSPSIESLQTNHSASESSLNSITKDFYDFSIVEDQIEKMKISWKAKKEFQYNEELLENEWKHDINILNDTEDESIQKEILEVENLDNLIDIMNNKIKEAIEETLTYQCENRKRLEKILASNPCETGKLAENTRQFFYLCPKYATLNTDFHNTNKSSETSNSEQQLCENEDKISLLNLDNEDEWKFINSTYYIEKINNTMKDFYINPYIINTCKDMEITEMLLKTNKKQNSSDKQEEFLKKNDNIFNINNVISIHNTISTKNLQNIDNNLIDQDMEVQIMDSLSIVKDVENELNTVK